MPMSVNINGKEVTNPLARFAIMFGALLFVSLVLGVIVFVMLPLIGVAVTLSIGMVVIVLVASVVGAVVLSIVVGLFSALFGRAEVKVNRLPHDKRQDKR